jgi:hypothetical protein
MTLAATWAFVDGRIWIEEDGLERPLDPDLCASWPPNLPG